MKHTKSFRKTERLREKYAPRTLTEMSDLELTSLASVIKHMVSPLVLKTTTLAKQHREDADLIAEQHGFEDGESLIESIELHLAARK